MTTVQAAAYALSTSIVTLFYVVYITLVIRNDIAKAKSEILAKLDHFYVHVGNLEDEVAQARAWNEEV